MTHLIGEQINVVSVLMLSWTFYRRLLQAHTALSIEFLFCATPAGHRNRHSVVRRRYQACRSGSD